MFRTRELPGLPRQRALYFAYGSNLNAEDWERWCASHGRESGMLRAVGVAWLPDHELAFTRFSPARQSGVLDARPRVGSAVRGVVFEVTAAGWAALDEKEGHPKGYRRTDCSLIGEDGEIFGATTYAVRAPVEHVAPSDEYLELVRAGYRAHGLDTGALADAAEGTPDSAVPAIFVYGTLMRGESRHSLVRNHDPPCVILAEITGALLDLGDYPGLVYRREGGPVQGELVRFGDPAPALAEIDRVEGFPGFGAEGSLFRRILAEVHVGDGRVRLAWTYVWAGNDAGPAIASLCWREHRGLREAVLERIAAGHAGGDEAALIARVARGGVIPMREELARDLAPLARALGDGRVSERALAQASDRWAVEV